MVRADRRRRITPAITRRARQEGTGRQHTPS
jgi:hypothetical protein